MGKRGRKSKKTIIEEKEEKNTDYNIDYFYDSIYDYNPYYDLK